MTTLPLNGYETSRISQLDVGTNRPRCRPWPVWLSWSQCHPINCKVVNSWSGHMPRLQIQHQLGAHAVGGVVGVHAERQPIDVVLSFLPPLSKNR